MRPLDGITVITLEHAIAAPFCTRQLADLGARVIKVERPGVGDFARCARPSTCITSSFAARAAKTAAFTCGRATTKAG